MKKIDGLDCILLVDDENSNHFFNRLLIKKSGIDVHIEEAYDGIEALEYLTCTGKHSSENTFPQPGIIFLDINMPRMNGWEFMEKYDQLPDEQKGKIILAMLSATQNPDDRRRAEKLNGLAGFINKPLTLEHINKIVEENF